MRAFCAFCLHPACRAARRRQDRSAPARCRHARRAGRTTRVRDADRAPSFRVIVSMRGRWSTADLRGTRKAAGCPCGSMTTWATFFGSLLAHALVLGASAMWTPSEVEIDDDISEDQIFTLG